MKRIALTLILLTTMMPTVWAGCKLADLGKLIGKSYGEINYEGPHRVLQRCIHTISFNNQEYVFGIPDAQKHSLDLCAYTFYDFGAIFKSKKGRLTAVISKHKSLTPGYCFPARLAKRPSQ